MARWIQKLRLKKGATRHYLMQKYGRKAFDKHGKIKLKYLNRAIRTAKNSKIKKRLILAKTFLRIRGRH